MRLDTADYHVNQSDQRPVHVDDTKQSSMTPARRAALDALEREFQELLQAAAR